MTRSRLSPPLSIHRGTMLLTVLLLSAATVAPTWAQQPRTRSQEPTHETQKLRARHLGSNLPQGLVSTDLAAQAELGTWDGTDEEGYTYEPGPGIRAEFVQKFNLPADSGVVESVTGCFFFPVALDSFEYDVVFYRNSGGQPGSLIAEIPLVAGGLLEGGVCLTGETQVAVNQSMVFVGVRFEPMGSAEFGYSDFGVDINGPLSAPGFARALDGDPWLALPSDFPFDQYRSFAIDILFSYEDETVETCAVQACVPSATTLCLQNDRFEVSATYVDLNDNFGDVFLSELTQDTGTGYIFDDTNIELVVKVLNPCAEFNRFWVFAAGLTDQGIDLRVCDRETGQLNIYTSPLGTPFAPITDTDAFATCP